MQYLGGKNRIRKQVSSFLESVRKQDQIYFEPFCGANWILQEMKDERVASDGNTALVTLYKFLQNGWLPPTQLTEEQYTILKQQCDVYDPLTAFAGIGCSFSGKWFGGYSRGGIRNYALNAHNTLLRQLPKIKDVEFRYGLFHEHTPKYMLVYCDPPYEGTTQYSAFSGFNNTKFWNRMREWSTNNTVVISEYKAPDDFKCVLEINTKTDMRVAGTKQDRIERLFMYKG